MVEMTSRRFSPITKKIAEEIEIKGDKFIFNLFANQGQGQNADGVGDTGHDGNINIGSEVSYEEKIEFYFSDYEKAYQEKLDKIAEEILKESENTCHMDMLLSVTYNDSHKNDYGVTIWEEFRCRSLSIAGEKVDMSQEDKEYNQLLLYWYNENIW